LERIGIEAEDHSGPLHYTTTGAGPPIIALHGFGATSYAWRFMVPVLAQRYEVFLVDLKGHGASPRPLKGRYSLDAQAELVSDLIRKRNLQNVTLIGNSLGGGVALTLALQLAAEGSKRISALILLDTIYKAPVPFAFRVLRLPVLGRLAMALPARISVLLTLRYVTVSVTAQSRDAVDAYAVNLTAPGGKEALLQCVRQIDIDGIDDIVRDVRALDVRSLILWGSHDPLFDVKVGAQLSGDLKSSHYHVIPQCGHLPQEERPEEVLLHVQQFLQNNIRTSTPK
jgi:pimeloyl-ACP methyl ester carboxylesterase